MPSFIINKKTMSDTGLKGERICFIFNVCIDVFEGQMRNKFGKIFEI